MRELLVATTFRDFDGGENDAIQFAFLDSLKNQTYKNFRLVVTNFREKNVYKTLCDNYEFKLEFHQSTSKSWHSFTETIENSFHLLKTGRHILVWTNADNIFQENFFQELVNSVIPKSGGTSYPHICYPNLNHYKMNKPFEWYYGKKGNRLYHYDPNVYVPDVVFIDGDVFLEEDNIELFKKHRIYGAYPGAAQTLMFTFFARKKINIYYKSIVANIQNNERLYKEKRKKVKPIEWERNETELHDFCQHRRINERFVYDRPTSCSKLNQIKTHKTIGNIWQKAFYKMYLFYYTLRPRQHWIFSEVMRKYIKNIVLFLYHRRLLPMVAVKMIITINSTWNKYFVQHQHDS